MRKAPHSTGAVWRVALLGTLTAVSSGTAQTAAPDQTSGSTVATSDRQETVVMSPFEVTTDKDRGYRATNSISGSRLNTPIKDIPMPIEVITEKFIRDTGASDLRQSLRYSAGILLSSQNDQGTPGGAYQGPGGVNNPEGATGNTNQTTIKMRGYVTDAVLRDGYRRQNSVDSVNIGRIEVVRGPAALLYGIGNFGGIVNYMPKMPEGKQMGEATFSYGSYDFIRGTIDVTGPVTNTWDVRYRVTAAVQKQNDYTQYRDEHHYFVSPVITFKPTRTTDVVVDLEYGKQFQNGVGFQRVRGRAIGLNSDRNEHAAFLNLAGTDPRTFRWSGPDTYVDGTASNAKVQLTQELLPNLHFLLGANRSNYREDKRDVIASLVQNAGPAALQATIYPVPVDQANGSSDVSFQSGPVPNTVLEYSWGDQHQVTRRDQVRAELTYSVKLFQHANRWFRFEPSLLFGHSEERANTDTHTEGTANNLFNFKSPTDASPIRFGVQGDGTPDVGYEKRTKTNAIAWNAGTYGVFQGKLLDDRLTIVAGRRRDKNDTQVLADNYLPGGSLNVLTRAGSQSQNTDQIGATFQITREISVYALRAGGLSPNFSGALDVYGKPLPAIQAKSKEIGLKIDLFDGKISGTISKYTIKRTGTPINYWWAPYAGPNVRFNPNKPIVYNISNFTPSTVAGGSNGGNGAQDNALTEWNSALSSGAAYQKNNTWYLNASQPEGAAYLDKVFANTIATKMNWPGWLYPQDSETNNAFVDIASNNNNAAVLGSDSARGWDAQIMFTPNKNLQFLVTYANTDRIIDTAGQFAKYPYPQDRWAVWYFPNTDWGLTGKPISTVYGNAEDTSTWTGIGYGSGEKQDDTPKHHVSFFGNYAFTTGYLKGLTVGAGGYWESPREYMSGITHGSGQRVTDSHGNLVVLRTKVRYDIDLMVKYDFRWAGHDASVQANVYNLLDDQKLYGLVYSAPITARVELSYKF